jgi:hypothetical protein
VGAARGAAGAAGGQQPRQGGGSSEGSERRRGPGAAGDDGGTGVCTTQRTSVCGTHPASLRSLSLLLSLPQLLRSMLAATHSKLHPPS